jgi:intracellular sulfur oxidation DsrE/DsrF family protein
MNTLTKTIALAALAALPLTAMNAQTEKPTADKTHRIVFEVTMEGPEQWTAVLNNVENVRTALGAETEIEVIAHGKGLGMLAVKNNTLTDRMKKLADDGVVFAACENTMKKKNVSKDDLLPLATTVDSGVAEVVRKQEAGWSYVKSGI